MNSSTKPEHQKNVSENVLYCLTNIPEANSKRFAEDLGVNPSTITRWRQGMSPRRGYLLNLAHLLGLEAEWFSLPNADFILRVQDITGQTRLLMDYRKVEQRLVLGATEKWKHLWDECAANHVGSYIMYSRILTERPNPLAAIWLLRILERTDRGIRFTIHDVDTRVPAESDPIIYTYSGLMFPVAQTLFFIGDEHSGDEPFAMITTAAQVPGRSPLCGHFIAVGVSGEVRKPAGTKVVGYPKSRKVLEVSDVINELRITRFDSLPKEIQWQI